MKTSILLAAAVALSFPMIAQAKTLKFPSEAPIASVSIPNSWSPKETETGVDGTSDDGAIYFSIDVASEANMDKIIDVAFDFLTSNGVTVDDKTKKESPEQDVNGMKLSSIDYQGTDKDGPVDVSIGFASPREGKLLIITYWGSKDTEVAHAKEVVDIVNSMKPVK